MTRSRSGCAQPGVGEIRPVSLPEPGPDDVVVRTLCSGISRGTETLVFRGGVPREPVRHDARAVPGGRLSRDRSSTATSTSASSSTGRPTCRAARSSASTRTRRRTWCRPDRWSSCPTACPPARAVLAGTVETAVNALWDAAPLVGDRVTVVGAGMVGCCVARLLARIARRAGDPGRRRRRPSRRRRRARRRLRVCRPTRPAVATSSCTPARPRPGFSGRWTCWRRRPRSSTSAGTATPRSRCRSVAPSTPGGSASAPARSALWRAARRATRTTTDRLTLALDLLARPRLRRAAHRVSRLRRAARGDGRSSRPAPCPRCATPSATARGERDVQRDGPRPHDDRPQLSR